MSETINYKKYYPTAFILYISYFVHGIGVSILGQYKQDFAGAWGASTLADGSFDVSTVLLVIAALGLGRLITLPVSGPLSDKLGRKICSLIGVACYAIYFLGIIFAPNMYVAYVFALIGGAANSFLDTGVIPACLEILVESSGLATILTKLFISVGQYVLPVMMGFIAANNMSYTTVFYVMAALIIIDGILIAIMPLPPMNNGAEKASQKEAQKKQPQPAKQKMKFTPQSIALICIGFTCTATFQLWLNCSQEFGRLCGMENPSQIQSYYSIGTIVAVLLTAVIIKSWVKPVRIILVYPAIATLMLIAVYLIQTPVICLVGGFVIGFSAAGGVLQMVTATANDMFPENKGKITSIVMIASSIANYVILNIAGVITKSGGMNGPAYVLLFNAGLTIIGVLLAAYVNMKYKNEPSQPVKSAAGAK